MTQVYLTLPETANRLRVSWNQAWRLVLTGRLRIKRAQMHNRAHRSLSPCGGQPLGERRLIRHGRIGDREGGCTRRPQALGQGRATAGPVAGQEIETWRQGLCGDVIGRLGVRSYDVPGQRSAHWLLLCPG